MMTISEFLKFDSIPYLLGGLSGAAIGNQYSEQGKTRTQLSNDLAKSALLGGALYSGVSTLATKGKLGENLKEGVKTALQLGGSSIIGGQLGYRNKYKKQYDANPNQRSDKGIKRGKYNR